MKLSIVIPAYNEEARLGRSLQVYHDYFAPAYGAEAEIIVVVNGSADATERVARDFAVTHPMVTVLVEPRKVGKGGAIMIGFRAAQGEIVGFSDADAATPPDAFDDLVRNLGDAGGAIATRWHPDAQVWPRQTWQRRLASRLFNGVVELLFGLGLRDTQCGAKVLSRAAMRKVLPHIGITRWAFDVDLLFQLRRAGFRVIERPTKWHDVGGSQLRLGRASAEMLVALIRLRLIYSPLRWIVDAYDRTLGRKIHLAP